LFALKRVRLLHEKLIIFPYGQYIVGIYVSLAFKFEVDAGFKSNWQKYNS